jgi:hypothetical protein
MDAYDDLVERIVAKGLIPTAARRREITSELRSHLDDLADHARASGHDDATIRTIVRRQFGEPDDIARRFATTYRADRIRFTVVLFVGLAVASVASVGAVIAIIQLLVAAEFGGTIRAAFRGMQWEAVGFVALTWGYVGLYVLEHLFRRWSVRTAILVHGTGFAAAAVCLQSLAHGHASTPAVAFVAATMVRIAQRMHIPLAVLAGTAAPLLAAWVLRGPLVSGLGRLTSWEVCGVIWIGMSLSCRAMTALVAACDRHVLEKL